MNGEEQPPSSQTYDGYTSSPTLDRSASDPMSRRSPEPNSTQIDMFQGTGQLMVVNVDVSAGETLFEAAAEIDPKYGMPRYNAARIYAQRGDVDKGIENLEKLK